MSEKKINLLNLDRKGLRALFSEMGEKPFRADQLMKWIYHFGVSDFEDMNNINKALRAKLAAKCEIVAPEIASYQKSWANSRIEMQLKNSTSQFCPQVQLFLSANLLRLFLGKLQQQHQLQEE